jgi:hypothetical protein
MLFREIVTVYCDNNTEHANTLRGQNSREDKGTKGKVTPVLDSLSTMP